MDNQTHCANCGAKFYPRHFYDVEQTKPMDTGYGVNSDGTRVCFECCALEDLRILRETGKHSRLYLVKQESLYKGRKETDWFVVNWPGTLRIKTWVTIGCHNIAGVRRDCWFAYNGYRYHGVSLGHWNEICRIKRTKELTDGCSVILPEVKESNND
jgi:hypothetical protein